VYGSVDTDAFRAADLQADATNASDARLSAISTYGPSRWPDLVDADGDGQVDNWDSLAPGGAQHTLAGSNVNHPAYPENYQLKMTPGWLRSAEGRDFAGVPLAQNLPDQEHEVKYSAVHTSSDVMVFATGPGAAFFGRSLDNTEIFFGLAAAIGAATDLGGPAPAPAPPADSQTEKVVALSVASSLLAVYGAVVTAFAFKISRGQRSQQARGYSDSDSRAGGNAEVGGKCADTCWDLVGKRGAPQVGNPMTGGGADALIASGTGSASV